MRKTHYVNVMSPTERTDEHGQPTGTDDVYIADVPCSIETLSGREGEIARQQYQFATQKVEFYADPARPVDETHYLQFGERRLEIGFVNDIDQRGVVYSLLCGEVKKDG